MRICVSARERFRLGKDDDSQAAVKLGFPLSFQEGGIIFHSVYRLTLLFLYLGIFFPGLCHRFL